MNQVFSAGVNFIFNKIADKMGLPSGYAEDYMENYTIVVRAPIPENHTLFLRGASTDGTKAYVRLEKIGLIVEWDKVGREITWNYPGVSVESKFLKNFNQSCYSVDVFCSHKFEYKFLLDDKQWEVIPNNGNRTINFGNDFRDGGNVVHEIKF